MDRIDYDRIVKDALSTYDVGQKMLIICGDIVGDIYAAEEIINNIDNSSGILNDFLVQLSKVMDVFKSIPKLLKKILLEQNNIPMELLCLNRDEITVERLKELDDSTLYSFYVFIKNMENVCEYIDGIPRAVETMALVITYSQDPQQLLSNDAFEDGVANMQYHFGDISFPEFYNH
jgi:hypothetical protein